MTHLQTDSSCVKCTEQHQGAAGLPLIHLLLPGAAKQKEVVVRNNEVLS